MQVVFIKELSGIAHKGEVKDFNDGYARNFLVAKGYALAITPQILQKIRNEQQQQAAKQRKELERDHKLKAELEKRIFSIAVKVGEKNQIFGSVHEKDILERIKEKTSIELEKNQIVIPKRIKELGEYAIQVKLANGITANSKIQLVALNQN